MLQVSLIFFCLSIFSSLFLLDLSSNSFYLANNLAYQLRSYCNKNISLSCSSCSIILYVSPDSTVIITLSSPLLSYSYSYLLLFRYSSLLFFSYSSLGLYTISNCTSFKCIVNLQYPSCTTTNYISSRLKSSLFLIIFKSLRFYYES